MKGFRTGREDWFAGRCHVRALVSYDDVMKKTKSLYHGHRFPASVISHAVRWYFRFQLSLRDIEELLFERGVVVSHESIRRWTDKFGAGFAHQVRTARRKPGSTWPAKTEIPELANVKHVFVKACARVNNRAENRSYEASKSSTG
ncbi:transposase-like protein [Paraburkholderia sp. Clong3]